MNRMLKFIVCLFAATAANSADAPNMANYAYLIPYHSILIQRDTARMYAQGFNFTSNDTVAAYFLGRASVYEEMAATVENFVSPR